MHIHLVGIAGSMTAPLAIALQKQGHHITGSDQEKTFPPFSQQLKKSGIQVNQTQITPEIDLAIIGSSYSSFINTKEEFLKIKKLHIPYLSATKYISKYLIKKNSILIAGSYGKTTITAALSYLLIKSGAKPSYMFGAQSINKIESLHFSTTDWSVVEADESINGLDKQAKFLQYPVKYLILTSAKWEHQESYQNELENFTAFKKLVEHIPTDGLLIYNPKDLSLRPLLPFAKCQKFAYQETNIKNNLIGKYNQENLGAVETLANKINISPKIIRSSFSTFKGIKRRLELSYQNQNLKFIDDFAQSADRIKAALQALKDTYPQSHLKVFYEAHASFMQYPQNFKQLSSAFNASNEVVIYRLNFNSKIKSSNRISAKDFLSIIPNSLYLPLSNKVVEHYQNTLEKGDILIHFSSGGIEGQKTFKKIISLYKK